MYTGALTDYSTPDGRQFTFPSDFAAQFPGLTQVQPPPVETPAMPLDVGLGQGGAPPAAEISPPPSQSAPPPTDQGPVTMPSQVPAGGEPSAPAGPVTSPSQDAGPQNQPAPAPPATNKQLLQEGPAGVLAAQNRAIDQQQAAIERSAQIEADTATKQGQLMAARDAETDRILQEKKRQAEANEAELNARIQARDQLADQIAKTRIDRSVDHPIWAQIGILLGTIGTAMRLRPGEAWNNPAYDTLLQMLDRKVNGQVQDLEQKRQALGQMNVGIGEQRQHNADRLTEIDARRDAALQQAQQAVQTIATQMKSSAALANAQQLNAKLNEERATLRGQAAERIQAQVNTERAQAQAYQMHKESLGMQYRIHRETIEAQEREKMAQVAAELLKENKAEAAARAKLVSEQGLVDPSTGKWLLNEDGQRKMAQADAYEAKARKSDPDTAQRLVAQAQALRQSAQQNDMAVGLNKKGTEDAQEVIKQAQDITNRIDAARKMLQADPSTTDRETWAALTVYLDGIKRDYAQGGKERLSPLAINSMKDILAIDPEGVVSRSINKKKAIAALTALEQQTTQSADLAVKNAGVSAGWRPSKPFDAASWEGRTAAEIADDEEPGFITRHITGPVRADIDMLTSGRAYDEDIGSGAAKQREALEKALARPGPPLANGEPGPPSNYGLDPNQEATANALIARARNAGDAEYRDVLQQLAAPLLKISGSGARPSLAIGVAKKLQDEDPGLFNAVLSDIANKPGGGAMKAKEITDAVPQPELVRTPSGGNTPGAEAERLNARDRVKRGLPAEEPKRPAPPQLPEFLRNSSVEAQQQYLDALQKRGLIGAVGPFGGK